VDFSKLSTNNWIAGGGAAVLLVSGLLPWFRVDSNFVSFSRGAGSLGWLGILLVAGGAAVLFLKVFEVNDIRVQSLSAEQLGMALSALGAVIVVLRVLAAPDGFGRGFFALVGLISAVAATMGLFLSAQDKGIGIPSVEDFTNSDGGSSDTPPTTF